MKLIGITGFAGSGKDTVYGAIAARRELVFRVAFADALKAEIVHAFACDPDLFDDPAIKEITTPELAPRRCIDASFVRWLGPTMESFDTLRPRFVMQQWGDYRRALDPDYWVRPVASVVEGARVAGMHATVITDVRFLNEYLWLQESGGRLWRVVREGVRPRSGHASEWQLEGVRADLLIRNDYSLEELEARALAAYDDVLAREAST